MPRCPDPVCGYMGKDKQDIQRHYTGKHSILKMWVDAFLREMAGEASRDEVSARARAGRELTFRQMELRAIQQQQDLEEDDDIAEVVEDTLLFDLTDPNLDRLDIRTVWVSSSSMRWPRLSVTLLSSRTAPMFSAVKMVSASNCLFLVFFGFLPSS